MLCGAADVCLPVPVPYLTGRRIYAGEARTSAVDSFFVIEVSSIQVADREMSEKDVADDPRCCLLVLAINSLTEEGQLKPEPAPVAVFQVACVIPPFRRVVRVIEVVARELVSVSG